VVFIAKTLDDDEIVMSGEIQDTGFEKNIVAENDDFLKRCVSPQNQVGLVCAFQAVRIQEMSILFGIDSVLTKSIVSWFGVG
jgi:hypothetical protein